MKFHELKYDYEAPTLLMVFPSLSTSNFKMRNNRAKLIPRYHFDLICLIAYCFFIICLDQNRTRTAVQQANDKS